MPRAERFDEVYVGDESTEENRVATIGDIGDSSGGSSGAISGTVERTADGSSTEFRFTVDADVTPETVFVQAASEPASTDFYSEYDDATDEIVVTYARAPADGETLRWEWLVDSSVTSVTPESHNHDGDSLTPQSLHTEKVGIGDGLIKTTYPEDPADKSSQWIEETFSTVQDAVDAIPLSFPDTGRTAGHVEIMALGADSQSRRYDGNVSIEDRITVEGQGHSTLLSTDGGTSAPTVSIDGDDCRLKHIWVDNPWSDNTTDGDAVYTTGSEVYLEQVNVDFTGRHALNVNGARNYISQCEIKDGDKAAVRISGVENTICETIIHDERGNNIPIGLEIGNAKRMIVSDVYIMLNDADEAIDWTVANQGDDGLWQNVYIGPSNQVNGNISSDVELRGKRGRASNFIIRGTGLDLNYAQDFDFYGFIEGGINRWGTRNSVGGFGVNAGDPSSTGDWNGFSDNAFKRGVTIFDTSSEGDIYQPLPPSATNNWVRISGTAL